VFLFSNRASSPASVCHSRSCSVSDLSLNYRAAVSTVQANIAKGAFLKTFCEFSFDAAHSVAPFSPLHGHTFVVKVTFGGTMDPVYGWPVNLYEVERFIDAVKGTHEHPGIDHSNLDLHPEINVASLENIAIFLWKIFKTKFPGLEEIELKRGFQGSTEGCVYRGDGVDSASISLAA
jgi:6-pyruvoyltetrahydropterin/6-carboxytetrahydropterin synthase